MEWCNISVEGFILNPGQTVSFHCRDSCFPLRRAPVLLLFIDTDVTAGRFEPAPRCYRVRVARLCESHFRNINHKFLLLFTAMNVARWARVHLDVCRANSKATHYARYEAARDQSQLISISNRAGCCFFFQAIQQQRNRTAPFAHRTAVQFSFSWARVARKFAGKRKLST